jgi:alkylation response protein AidB-like acyl-CoA dehydrogenase
LNAPAEAGATFLHEERATLERFLPGLDDQLAQTPLRELESKGSQAIELFRAAGGCGLIVQTEHHGSGASLLDTVRIQRAIGARSPSLAVATTMHHFSAASLVVMSEQGGGGFEWMLLQAIADERKLLASGFGEGVSGRGMFAPTMRARRSEGQWHVSGAKKPCSLAHSMDLLTASVAIEGDGVDDGGYAVALIPSDAPGLEVEPFWEADVLAGAQNEAVILNDVPVDDELVFPFGDPADALQDDVQAAGFVWFEALMSASYIGMASALAERVLSAERWDPSATTAPIIELEGAFAAVEGLARELALTTADSRIVTRSLAVRYAAQGAITRAVASAVEQLGGVAFMRSNEVGYFAGATRALALHPPGRFPASAALRAAYAGEPLVIR